MKKVVVAAALIAGSLGFAQKGYCQKGVSDRCYAAERGRQKAEIDHALGRNSERDLRAARDKADKACK